jgi:hypothetical protein
MVNSAFVTNLIQFNRRRNKVIGINFDNEFIRGLVVYNLSLDYQAQLKLNRAVFLKEYMTVLIKGIRELTAKALKTNSEERRILYDQVLKLNSILENTVAELEELACQP